MKKKIRQIVNLFCQLFGIKTRMQKYFDGMEIRRKQIAELRLDAYINNSQQIQNKGKKNNAPYTNKER